MAIQDQKPDTTTRELNAQALALAEQLGRIAGTLEGTAEAWLNRASVTDQLTEGARRRDAVAQQPCRRGREWPPRGPGEAGETRPQHAPRCGSSACAWQSAS